MLNINSITVRLGGRTILDRASAAIRPRSRVGRGVEGPLSRRRQGIKFGDENA